MLDWQLYYKALSATAPERGFLYGDFIKKRKTEVFGMEGGKGVVQQDLGPDYGCNSDWLHPNNKDPEKTWGL